MLKDLAADQKILANFMSEISERCFSAGWMKDLEYVLWDALTTGPRKYGQDAISQNDITKLKSYCINADGWIIFDDNLEETGLSINEWSHRFNIAVKNDPGVIGK